MALPGFDSSDQSLEQAYDPTAGALRLNIGPQPLPQQGNQPQGQGGQQVQPAGGGGEVSQPAQEPTVETADNNSSEGFQLLSDKLAEQGQPAPTSTAAAPAPASEPTPQPQTPAPEQQVQAPSAQPAPGTPPTLDPIPSTIAHAFLEHGYTAAQTAGALGTIAFESGGFNPAITNPKSKAFGLFQHFGSRLDGPTGLKAYAASQNASPADPGVQIQFALQELAGDEAPAAAALRRTTNAADAASVFRSTFERPGVNYDPAVTKWAMQYLPAVQAMAASFQGKAPNGEPQAQAQAQPNQPTPDDVWNVAIPNYGNQPQGNAPTSARTAEQRTRFQQTHSADLSPFAEFAKHVGLSLLSTGTAIGGGILQSAAQAVDRETQGPFPISQAIQKPPSDVTSTILKSSMGGHLQKPFSWLEDHVPTGAEMVRKEGQMLGYDFANPSPTNWGGDLGEAVGSSVAASTAIAAAIATGGEALPGLAEGLAGTVGPWGAAAGVRGLGWAGQALKAAAADPLKYILGEGVELGAAGGFGAGEAHSVYSDVTGDVDPNSWGSLASQIIGGGVSNALRIPIARLLTGAGTGIFRSILGLAQGFTGKPGMEAVNSMTAGQADAAVSGALRQITSDAIDSAKQQIADLGVPRGPMAGNAGTYWTNAAKLLQTAVETTYNAARVNQRMLWQNVDKDVGRDYSATLTLKKQLQNQFLADQRDYNRQPTDFPTDFLQKVFSPVTKVTDTGLLDANGNPVLHTEFVRKGLDAASSLGAGQETRSAIEGEVRRLQLDPSIPGRRSQIAVLNKLAASLLDDMTAGTSGANPQALQTALAYTRALAKFADSPEVAGVLTRNATGVDQANSVLALDHFLKTNQAGVAANETLLAGERLTGQPGFLTQHVMDALRQKFIEEVAPNGHVDPLCFQRFFDPTHYGSVLDQPEFASLKQELIAAGHGEVQALNQLSLGKDVTTRFSRNLSGAERREAATNLWLDNPVDQVMDHLKSASNQGRSAAGILAQLKRDPTGQAVPGFIKLVSDQAIGNPKGVAGLADWATANAGLVTEIGKVDPGFIGRLNSLSTVTNKAGLMAQGIDLGLRYLGSQVGGKVGNSVGSSMVMASAGSRMFRNWYGQLSRKDIAGLSGDLLANQKAFDAFQGAQLGNIPSVHLLGVYLAGTPAGILLNSQVDQESGQPDRQEGSQSR